MAPDINSGRDLHHPLPGPIVLWIDDELEAIKGAVEFLGLHGVRVDTAATGTAGISLAREHEYALILLELRLPDLSGIETFRALQNIGVDAPIVVVSGFCTIEITVTLMRMGVRDVLEKPLVGDEVVAAVQRYIGAGHGAHDTCRDEVTRSRALCEQLARATHARPQMSLGQAVRLVGVDRHVLERAVRRETGHTYRTWRRALTIRRAAVLLRCCPLPVKAIAYEFGYQSVQTFARAFRSVLGTSPSQYRQRISHK